MKKTAYNIRCRQDGSVVIKTVTGYVYNVGSRRYGISQDGHPGIWFSTELSTGYCTPIQTATLKAAVSALAKMAADYNPYAAELAADIEDANPDIVPEWNILTCHLTA